ncbi:hypothetical protein TcasGA2_TC031927 [Tribolium castaneum]|uniref:Uncharacterized protein n=1 Tax=Tribolium castaneum TaxID=7070 RepID=A0A139W8E2_TRICA|nr:hypothetical protein TcasGA2_TC031927 [Tribolium castaneum]
MHSSLILVDDLCKVHNNNTFEAFKIDLLPLDLK